MRAHPVRERFVSDVSSLLESRNDVVSVVEKLQAIYAYHLKLTPLVCQFHLELVPTEHLRSIEFYQTPAELLSEKSIRIIHAGISDYLWLEQREWCYCDEEYGPDSVAKSLANSDAFTKYPESVKDLFQLLKNGLWALTEVPLLSFGEARFDDFGEVLSWDGTNVLVGTSLGNIEIVSIDEWKRITNNEKTWFI